MLWTGSRVYAGVLSGSNCDGAGMNPLFYLFVIMGGMFNTVQSGANAQLRKSLDQPMLSGAAVYATGLRILLNRQPTSWRKLPGGHGQTEW